MYTKIESAPAIEMVKGNFLGLFYVRIFIVRLFIVFCVVNLSILTFVNCYYFKQKGKRRFCSRFLAEQFYF